MGSIDTELQKYYDAMFDMMGSPGWKYLMEDFENMRKAADTLNGIDDEKKLNFRRGELSIINLVLNRKDMCEKAYEGLKDETV